MQDQILREYQQVLSQLKSLESRFNSGESDETYDTFSSILRSLELGWLTPGTVVLSLLKEDRVSASFVLKQSRALQKKWFGELDEIEKGRWLLKFSNGFRNPKIRLLGEILDLTPRRLQQLQSQAKWVSS